MNIRVGSWNILCDYAVPKYEPQKNRIPLISDAINEVQKSADSLLLFLAECESKAIISEICARTDMVIIGEPGKSRKREEFNAFIANKELAKEALLSRIIVGKEPRAIFCCRIKDLTVVGCHMPAEILLRPGLAQLYMESVLKQAPNVVLGDFNTPPGRGIRKSLEGAGFIEAHKVMRPKYPLSHYRGKSALKYAPNLNLDAVYFLESLDLLATGFLYNLATDHPLLTADFVV